MTAIVDEIFDLFARFGSGHYGEDVSLETHMLQSATMAESMGAPANVVVAALLHDVGHLLHPGGEAAAIDGRNLEHEALGAAWLSRAFGKDVTAPIALHVEAKRYLCAVEPDYFDHLSDASRLSLVGQGGVMSEAEAIAFTKHPGFEAALILRRCDDLGKDASIETRDLEYFRDLITAALSPAN